MKEKSILRQFCAHRNDFECPGTKQHKVLACKRKFSVKITKDGNNKIVTVLFDIPIIYRRSMNDFGDVEMKMIVDGKDYTPGNDDSYFSFDYRLNKMIDNASSHVFVGSAGIDTSIHEINGFSYYQSEKNATYPKICRMMNNIYEDHGRR